VKDVELMVLHELGFSAAKSLGRPFVLLTVLC